MNISCFFPMYNEEGNVRKVVCSALAVLSKRFKTFEIIIVNDGSTDGTKTIAEELTRLDQRIKLVNHERNQGYGAALRSGFTASKHEVIFQADGDGQYDLDEIDRLVPYINDNDFVVGYRLKRADPFYRTLEALWYRFLLKALFGLSLKDANCAFKLFKKGIIDRLQLGSNGAIINGEIFVKAGRLGFKKIKEVGVNHYPRKAGRQTGAKLRVLWEAWAAIWQLWWSVRRSGTAA